VDEWGNAITAPWLEVPQLHLTLTTDDAPCPFFYADRVLLNDLLQVAPPAVQAVLTDLHPGVRVVHPGRAKPKVCGDCTPIVRQ
jgi:hypothetical protein